MYEKNKTVIDHRNPDILSSELNLFHGTTLESIDKICKHGFSRSFCGKNGTLFGKGVYFTIYAEYSNKFASSLNPPVLASETSTDEPKLNKFKHMILARVLVGMFEKGNPATIEPGIRPDGNQYDSTVNDVDNPSIYVIYRDYRAYPDYLIEYEVSS
jgi:poly [ADP-ribose] polymerase 10/14/15